MIGFFAHKNGVDQAGVPNGAYTTVTLPNTRFNTSGLFNTTTGKWSPPAGIVQISGQVLFKAGASATGTFIAQVVKNAGPTGVFTGYGAGASLAGAIAMGFSGWDLAVAGDQYWLEVIGASGATLTIDGLAINTFFSGAAFPGFSEKPPQTIDPRVKRFDNEGRSTDEQRVYENKLRQYLINTANSI